MAAPKSFSPVKLVCGIMSGRDDCFVTSEIKLEESFGPIDVKSSRHVFDQTDYYAKDMGPGLKRMFVSFERLIQPETLSRVKLRTNALENEIRDHFREGKRIVNLDPGYLTAAALIMATAKDFSHRVPLEHGIYAHLEFLFQKNSVQPLAWTYPDFRGGRYTPFFLESRRIYLVQLGPGGPLDQQR